jgi:hypothetical protein
MVNIGLKESRPSLFHWDRSVGEYRVNEEQTLSVPLGQNKRGADPLFHWDRSDSEYRVKREQTLSSTGRKG